MKKSEKIPFLYLLLSALICVVGVLLAIFTSHMEKNSYSDLQEAAAWRMHDAELYLKEKLLERGIEIEAEDLNKTGLLGPEFTELTSTPGNVDAKRTSLDPNFAAAMVGYYYKAGLKKGDVVAIGTSGSFPGLLIAAVTAATEMGLETRIIASCGSSMHGATRPDFNIFDILDLLEKGGYGKFNLLAVSPGGANDQGGSVLEDIIYFGTKELALQLCLDTGKPVLQYEDMADNIMARFVLYGDDVDLFVNVGGASPNCGTSSYTLNFPQGLVLNPPTIPTTPYRGLNYEFAAKGIPVLNLLNVKLLSQENGIAYDSVPLTTPGEGGAYYSSEYNTVLIAISIILAIAVLLIGFQGQRRLKQKVDSGKMNSKNSALNNKRDR